MFFFLKRRERMGSPYPISTLSLFCKNPFFFLLYLRAHLFFACYLRHLEAYYLRALVFKKGFSLFSIVLNASWGFFEEIFEDTLENF